MQPTSWSGARRPRKLHARLLRIARVKPEAKPVLFWWTAAEASDLRAIQSTCRFAQWPMTPALSWKSDEPRCQHKTIPVLFRIAPLLRMRRMFGDLVLNAPGEVSRKHLRRAGRGMLLLGAAACAAVGGCVALLLLTAPRFAGVLMWVIFLIACALIVVWAVFVVRGVARWSACRFAARADAALGAALSRLALQGHRAFNDVMLSQESFEHVVVGPR